MRRTMLVAMLALWSATALRADVAGSWKVDGSIGEFPVDLVCALKETDKKLSGVCKGNDIGELPVTGETDGKTATWSYEVNFQGQQFTIVYQATIESPTAMKGNITVMGNPSGSFTAKKQ